MESNAVFAAGQQHLAAIKVSYNSHGQRRVIRPAPDTVQLASNTKVNRGGQVKRYSIAEANTAWIHTLEQCAGQLHEPRVSWCASAAAVYEYTPCPSSSESSESSESEDSSDDERSKRPATSRLRVLPVVTVAVANAAVGNDRVDDAGKLVLTPAQMSEMNAQRSKRWMALCGQTSPTDADSGVDIVQPCIATAVISQLPLLPRSLQPCTVSVVRCAECTSRLQHSAAAWQDINLTLRDVATAPPQVPPPVPEEAPQTVHIVEPPAPGFQRRDSAFGSFKERMRGLSMRGKPRPPPPPAPATSTEKTDSSALQLETAGARTRTSSSNAKGVWRKVKLMLSWTPSSTAAHV
ncbi:hypothetical protein RI367_000076 [Sorochytrium milnesiophthora]